MGVRAAGSDDPRRSVGVGMTQARVVVRQRGSTWREVGTAFRHRSGGGWNLLLEGGIPDETLVIHDVNGYAPGASTSGWRSIAVISALSLLTTGCGMPAGPMTPNSSDAS